MIECPECHKLFSKRFFALHYYRKHKGLGKSAPYIARYGLMLDKHEMKVLHFLLHRHPQCFTVGELSLLLKESTTTIKNSILKLLEKQVLGKEV